MLPATMDVISTQLLNIYTLVLAIVIILILKWGFRQRKNLPPGPWGFPVIGCLPNLAIKMYRTGNEPEEILTQIAGDYGEVFSMYVGTKLVVVANGINSIKEAFQNPYLNDRPNSRVFEETHFDRGVLGASGERWKLQRKFTLRTLRSFGVGKTSFEGKIAEEAEVMIRILTQNKGKPYNPRNLMGNCVANVICSVVFNKRYDQSDPKFVHLLQVMNETIKKLGGASFEMFIPIMRYLSQNKHNSMISNISQFVEFVEEIIEEHRAVFDETNLNDFMDVFLNEIEQNKNQEQGKHLDNHALVATCVTLFLGAIETTVSSLLWIFLYMMAYPDDVQTRIHNEIDTIVGRNRLPNLADKSQLPYTEAVLLEIQRIRTITPVGLPHAAAEDTKLAGYDVPRGSIIVSNLWAVHNDPALWPEPEQFKPERFLDDIGRLQTREELIPFGSGRRICLGDNLAKMELFVFFAHILHQFSIKTPLNTPTQSLKGVVGASFSPLPFEICVESRL